jgi:hypothetical protein
MASSASETASDPVEEIPMTQKFRWLTALALLLAFGAGAVRAEEEEEEVPPPAHTSVELLPAPYPAPTAAAPHTAPCCQTCPSCARSTQSRGHETPADPMQYMVWTKIVTTNAEGDCDCDEMMWPKVTVFEGQSANILVQGVQTPTEHRDLALQIQVTKQGKDVRLALGVEHHMSICLGNGSDGAWAATRKVCNVTLGKMKRLVLEKGVDGSDRAWAEVTVTAIGRQDDADGSALDCVGDVVEDLIDTVADVATSLFCDDAKSEPIVASEYVQIPVAAAPREFQVPVMASCPAVKQCVAAEAVKMTNVHIHIDAKNNRTRVEVRNGNECWKGSAKHTCIANGELVLSGDVREESNGNLPELTAERITILLDKAVIDIGD